MPCTILRDSIAGAFAGCGLFIRRRCPERLRPAAMGGAALLTIVGWRRAVPRGGRLVEGGGVQEEDQWGIYAIKPRFRRLLRGTARALAGRGVTPDQVTTAGIVASGLGVLAFRLGGRWRGAFVAVPVLALARTAANALDGLVAEESGLGRPAGELYNETADRLGDIAFLAGTTAVRGVRPALAFGALAAAELSSFVGVSAKAAGGRRRYDGPMGKPDRMLVVGVAGLAAAGTRQAARVLNASLAVIGVGAMATAANRYRRAHAELDASGG